MTVRCNSKQLQAILKDFEDASVAVDVSYVHSIRAQQI